MPVTCSKYYPLTQQCRQVQKSVPLAQPAEMGVRFTNSCMHVSKRSPLPGVNNVMDFFSAQCWVCLFVGWLLNVPSACECISGSGRKRESNPGSSAQADVLTTRNTRRSSAGSPCTSKVGEGVGNGARGRRLGWCKPKVTLLESQGVSGYHEIVCLLVVQRPSNMLEYLRDGSAQTILRAATLR